MKSTVNINETKSEIQFPVLARLISCLVDAPYVDEIVLFSSPRCGTVVASPNKGHAIGDYKTNWLPVTDPCTWYILPTGTKVTLEVE